MGGGYFLLGSPRDFFYKFEVKLSFCDNQCCLMMSKLFIKARFH